MDLTSVFQLGKAYSQSLITYHTSDRVRPFSAAFSVTNRCNLHCVYCNCPNINTQELDLPQIEILFDRLKKLGIIRLGIFGGEPLVRKDIGEIISMAKKKGFFISLNTNLNLYFKRQQEVELVDYFFTSIDGTPEKHLANRGIGSLKNVQEAVRDLVKRQKKVTAICVVTGPDYDSAEYLLEFGKNENIDIHFQAECFGSERSGRESNAEQDHQQMKEFWQFLYQKKKEGAPITSSFNYLKHLIDWKDYNLTAFYDSKQTCAAGRGFICVEPTGMAYACAYLKGNEKAVGIDILKEDWAEKFNRDTPCTQCIAGPLIEFNLLFQKPVSTAIDALRKVRL